MDFNIDCVIGIDPGRSGGIAIYTSDSLTRVVKMPKETTDLRYLLQYYKERYRVLVFLEKLSVRPDDIGGENKMGKLYRITKLLANYEQLKATIESEGVPYVMVHPGKWTAALGLRKVRPDETKAERKARYKEFAARNYPGIKVTLWNADALNIMHFGRTILLNKPKWVAEQIPDREIEKLL